VSDRVDTSQYPLEGEVLPAHSMHSQPKISAADIWDALVASDGNIGAAARSLGCTRTYLQQRIDRNPDLIIMLDDLREEAVDQAESNQLTRAKSGADPSAERFVLQTLGKRRGWNTAVGGMSGSGDITVTITRFAEQQVIDE
jgi:hypothetical protein